MRDRVRRIFERLPQDVSAVVLQNGSAQHVDMAFFHATDLVQGGTFERACAMLHRDGHVDLLVPRLEETSARRAPDATVSTYQKAEERKEWLRKALEGHAKVGYNPPELTAQDYLGLREVAGGAELVDVSKPLADVRAVKDKVELERIRTACRIVSEVADMVPGLLRDGMKEFELAAELSYHMQRRGASGPSFDTIVAFGEGSAEPHYHPHDVPLRKGQFVLCDFGAWYQKYASDLTRTWIRGPASKDLRAIYDKVLEAEEAAIAAVRAGVKGGDVHLAAERVIDASPWKGRFIHSVGHSLGLAVHDGPALHPRHDWTLEAGMVVTIEPGIYVPGLGGVRIEDDVLVTKDGCEVLTRARKDDPLA
ncbi:MAG TPA: Xaa-Pro peptidase family protein [Candidatus Thermoplasmatota archaeon]|nr:Xaa-Pro peptidase family protein [Candidatus Thermoplasmatota archaeon]